MPQESIAPKKGSKTAPKPPEGHSGALIATADLQRETGYGHAVISEMAATGLIKQAKRGMWPAVETMGAMIRKLRARTSEAGQADRERKAKADADTSEMDALNAARKLCPIETAKAYVSDARFEIRQIIEREASLTPTQRTKLLTKIAELRPKPIPTE